MGVAGGNRDVHPRALVYGSEICWDVVTRSRDSSSSRRDQSVLVENAQPVKKI